MSRGGAVGLIVTSCVYFNIVYKWMTLSLPSPRVCIIRIKYTNILSIAQTYLDKLNMALYDICQ